MTAPDPRALDEREQLARDLCAVYFSEFDLDHIELAEKVEEQWELYRENADQLIALGYTRPAAAQPVAAWQPISEAPTNGTPVLLRDGDFVTVGVYLPHEPKYKWRVFDVRPPLGEGQWTNGLQATALAGPTHFMPLPEPPQ